MLLVQFKAQSDIQDIETRTIHLQNHEPLFKTQSDIQDIETWNQIPLCRWKTLQFKAQSDIQDIETGDDDPSQ